MRRAACLLALAAVLGVGLTYGQPDAPPAAKSPKPKVEKGGRFLYLVRYGAAKDLAATLSQHFRDEPGLQLVPEPNANALLITTPPSISDELVKLLDQLDRRPRQVVIDVLVAEAPLSDNEPVFDPADLSGPADKVLPKVEALARKSKGSHLRRFQFTALENQRSLVNVGSSQPYVTGGMVRGGGGFGPGGGGAVQTNAISYRDTGMMLAATPQLDPDGTITVDLKLDESRAFTPENGVALGNGVNATEFIHTTLGAKVAVGSGQARMAEGVKTEAKDAKVQAVVVVAAKVVEK